MKGDFSAWRTDPGDDHLGVLYQQGRLIADTDLTEGELIALTWRVTAGRDIVGAGVAAAPAGEPDGFRVERAVVTGDSVAVDLSPGRIWADGVHLALPGPGPVTWTATYLPEPMSPAGTSTADISDGTRDAVVLEVSPEALNGFQDLDRLIEPALGGPDTAERIIPRTALKLLRLGPGESCASIGPRLRDDLPAHGALTVELAPPTATAGDCPVATGGGYSGFEHNLYRIEIAETGGGPAMFKWSQTNGGLVGRGRFQGGPSPRVILTANRAAILTSGLSEFYLEALEWDADAGNWQVTYGTAATLDADGELDLATPPTFGTLPGSPDPVFFRLWNGLRPVSDFTNAADPVELRDGIRLIFEAGPTAIWRPGSWWSFEVRAGEIENPQTLLNDSPPEGPVIRRVPLAEITWSADEDTDLGGGIEDCRRRFRPLTNQKVCCTYIVGNGTTTFGDFNSLEEAARHLPPEGGRLCLLPGVHFANLELDDRRDVQIVGCRNRSFVLPRPASPAQPVIAVTGGRTISVADLDIVAPFGTAIRLEGRAPELRGVRVEGCRIMALSYGIDAETVRDLELLGNRIWLLDHVDGISTIAVRADDALIEQNHAGVWPFEFEVPGQPDDGDEGPLDPAEPCIEPEDLFAHVTAVLVYVVGVWTAMVATPPAQPYRARGGIHVRGGSTRVDLRRNRIDGGLGHGITLGGILPGQADPAPQPPDGEETSEIRPRGTAQNGLFAAALVDRGGAPIAGRMVSLAEKGTVRFADKTDEAGKVLFKAADGGYDVRLDPDLRVVRVAQAEDDMLVHTIVVEIGAQVAQADPDRGFLTRIRILENRIERMGLSGIGFWFYDLTPDPPAPPNAPQIGDLAAYLSALLAPRELIGTTNVVRDLVIRENRIETNLRAAFTEELTAASMLVAQGGISLALVEGLRIEDNHLTGNGVSAANPCAGIYVGYGEEVLISGNRIAGNGRVGEDYREARADGLRSGIFVRLASSVLAGGAEDTQHKPALVIRDNVVDQPAGRAITAFAYGPVVCSGNTLNSETEGAWNVFDDLVGALFIFNLGGVHRLGAFAKQLGASFTEMGQLTNDASTGASGSAALDTRIEAMLPGGETLVNSNTVRAGPENRAWCGQLVATVDDLGYDANQCGMFRPDVTFANLVAAANSLRVTDSRFRERARFTALSALTITGGQTVGAGSAAMNITTQNQGEHCIVAIAEGSMPAIDSPNQVVHAAFCPATGDDTEAKRDYVLRAFVMAWAMSVNPQIDADLDGAAIDAGLVGAIDQVNLVQVDAGHAYNIEAERLTLAGGHGKALMAAELKTRAQRLTDTALSLRVQQEVLAIRPVPPPADGAVLDGRVADRAGRGSGKLTVELVDAGGEALGPRATTDARGYYALPLTRETIEALGGAGGVFVRVLDRRGQELARAPRPLALGDRPRVSVDVALPRRPILSGPIGGGEVIFDLPARPGEPAGPGRPAQPDRPTGPVGPARPPQSDASGGAVRPPRPEQPRIALKAVRGIGRTLAERLREAGIEDANTLLELDDERLAQIVGNRAAAIRRAAAEAVAAAGGDS